MCPVVEAALNSTQVLAQVEENLIFKYFFQIIVFDCIFFLY